MPNSDQLLGVLRAILAFGGGWAVSKGYTDSATATAVAGAVVTIAMAGWSLYTNSQAAMIKSVNAADNGVKVVPNTVTASAVDGPIPALTTAGK